VGSLTDFECQSTDNTNNLEAIDTNMKLIFCALTLLSVIVFALAMIALMDAQAVSSTIILFIVPRSIPLTIDSTLTATLLNPNGTSGEALTWTYNGTDFTSQNTIKPVWPSDDYIDFHDSDMWHYAFTVDNATIGQRYSMCLQVEHLKEYQNANYEERQCEWGVVDKAGIAFVTFEDPAVN